MLCLSFLVDSLRKKTKSRNNKKKCNKAVLHRVFRLLVVVSMFTTREQPIIQQINKVQTSVHTSNPVY